MFIKVLPIIRGLVDFFKDIKQQRKFLLVICFNLNSMNLMDPLIRSRLYDGLHVCKTKGRFF